MHQRPCHPPPLASPELPVTPQREPADWNSGLTAPGRTESPSGAPQGSGVGGGSLTYKVRETRGSSPQHWRLSPPLALPRSVGGRKDQQSGTSCASWASPHPNSDSGGRGGCPRALGALRDFHTTLTKAGGLRSTPRKPRTAELRRFGPCHALAVPSWNSAALGST